ncbi:hypothetical protein BDP27DRAFT_1431175 [Rhodocollybia butyracea]|uniref:Uncharacterized protein n=1 Tax=Rhodocollybia butyracea TaxID=206335 RepID=A0A9P5TYU4_9AGAR|nr:hypothetical protein BDP27DRAFT_1431175 [Rhodocollybia butyracea]
MTEVHSISPSAQTLEDASETYEYSNLGMTLVHLAVQFLKLMYAVYLAVLVELFIAIKAAMGENEATSAAPQNKLNRTVRNTFLAEGSNEQANPDILVMLKTALKTVDEEDDEEDDDDDDWTVEETNEWNTLMATADNELEAFMASSQNEFETFMANEFKTFMASGGNMNTFKASSENRWNAFMANEENKWKEFRASEENRWNAILASVEDFEGES